MKIQNLVKTLIVVLMAIFFIVPSLAGAAGQSKKKDPVLETSKTTMGSEVINQEVIQVLRKGDINKVTMNIAGQPGIYFKIEYSTTGAEGSYKPLPQGKGVIGSNGFATVRFDLKKLGKDEVYLTVTTSDTTDFAEPRVMPKPLVFMVEQIKIKDRGIKDDYEQWIKAQRQKAHKKFDPPVQPTGGAVRG